MDKFGRLALLYDFYGQLLTPKQREILELYYEQNLSLGEIAGDLTVSRQAVHDILRRCEKTLENYEQKLGLVDKHLKERSKLNEAAALLQEINPSGSREPLDRVSEIINEILEL